MAETPLESFLIGHQTTATQRPRCRVVVGDNPLRFHLGKLQDALNRAAAGDLVAYAVPLEAPPLSRLWTLVTLGVRLRRAEGILARSGMASVGRYGVDPRLAAPAFVYQLNSAASEYADRFLRDRGPAAAFRRLAARCFGYDPAIGAVIVMGRKS